jgi:transcriptional regulator with GAF, ATPase, and Fis domain
VLVFFRQEVRTFNDKQIALVQNFASQAVIAIENARLLNELRERTADLTEALEQQTATSDILSVISGSPGQLEPVFQTILANATRICEANFGILNVFDGSTFHNRATHGIAAEYMDFLRRNPQRADSRNTLGRLLEAKEPIHVADLTMERAYLEREPTRVGVVDIGGARTLLAIPMLQETRVIGAVVIYRKEVRPSPTNKLLLSRTSLPRQSLVWKMHDC